MTPGVVRNPFLGLLALVFLNLFLLSVQIRSEDGRLLIRSWGLRFFSPFAIAVQFASDTLDGWVGRYVLLGNIRERNLHLEEENWKLKAQLSRLESIRRQVEIDAEFALLRERFEFEYLRAAIIWRNPALYSDKVVINAGTRHGVQKDAAVLTPDGIVGRVRAISEFAAEVELITDVNAAAGAQVGEVGLQGVITGTGREELRLNFVLSTAHVELGDLVVTSGADGIYPKGVPIGKVIGLDTAAGIYMEIRVSPLVDFRRLEEVAAVVDKR